MPPAIKGIIEGFYGRPWLVEERLLVMAEGARWGLTDYVYAPKDDPKHRAEWRAPYDDSELDGFRRLAEAGTLRLGFGISPGLSIDPTSDDDARDLAAKCDQVVDAGARLVVLCLDDIPFGGGEQGRDHALVAARLRDHLGDRADLAFVPTEYVGIRPTAYLQALAAGLPDDVPVGWTGDAVVNDAITAVQARRRADALAGRPPLVWDNLPVNDGLMAERLHLGPMWGRDPGLLSEGVVSGWLANPMVQPVASLLPLASMAGWLRGEDPLDAWAAEADRRGWRVFAEACDGAAPRALVAVLADEARAGRIEPEDLAMTRHWFEEAAKVEVPRIDDACNPWLDAVRTEAGVALAALDLIDAATTSGGGAGIDLVSKVFVLGFRWKALQRSTVSVMGPRLGFRPVLGQAADGTWTVRRASLVEGENAVDALCRLAFDVADWSADQP